MTTYVLIPGAGGDAWYWHLLVPELEARGHEAVAVDLPTGDDTAGLAEYADAVVEAIGDRTEVVLVAQSMGGFTAPSVCRQVPVDLLVLVNPMIPAPGETAGQWWDNTGQAAARAAKATADGRPVDGEFDPMTEFFHDVPDAVTAEAMAQGAPEQSDTPFGDPWPLDRWPDVPTRVVTGRDDRLFPAEFQVRLAQERLGITPDVIPGGHLVALSQPAALADQLEAYRAEVTSRA